MRILLCAAVLLLLVTGQSGAADAISNARTASLKSPPRFRDFRVTEVYSGPVAQPRLTSREAREFRTRLREAASGKPNFAGHYLVAQWGCGTECVTGAIIDAKTGAVTFFPFLDLCCWGKVADRFEPIKFRLDSRLITFSGELGEKPPLANHHFVLSRGRFKPLGMTKFDPNG